jgi:hypothetical protein
MLPMLFRLFATIPYWCSLKSTGLVTSLGLWETVDMAKHEFKLGVVNSKGAVVGARCIRCGKAVVYENGKIPKEIQSQACKGEDTSQAALLGVRESTENKA